MGMGGRVFPLDQPAPAFQELQGPTDEQRLFALNLLAQRQREAIQQGQVPEGAGGGDTAREAVINSILGEEPSQLTADQLAPAMAFQEMLAQNRDLLSSPDRTMRSYAFGASGILPYAAAMLQKPAIQEQLRQQRAGAATAAQERERKAGLEERGMQARERTVSAQEKLAEAQGKLTGAQAEALPYTSGQKISPLEQAKMVVRAEEAAARDSLERMRLNLQALGMQETQINNAFNRQLSQLQENRAQRVTEKEIELTNAKLAVMMNADENISSLLRIVAAPKDVLSAGFRKGAEKELEKKLGFKPSGEWFEWFTGIESPGAAIRAVASFALGGGESEALPETPTGTEQTPEEKRKALESKYGVR